MESDEANSTPSDGPEPLPNGPGFKGLHPNSQAGKRHAESLKRQEKFLQALAKGLDLRAACDLVGITWETYRSWRRRDKAYAGQIDAVRATTRGIMSADDGNLTHAEFSLHYFGMSYASFHLQFLEELQAMRPGNILMCLFPPEHGKTTMFENYCGETLARDPDHRFIVISENQKIARKILGRVKNRMEPLGPFGPYVANYGPFVPQTGEGRKPAQPWGADYFNVYKKSSHDERDYSLNALGADSSIVSTRSDHCHIDDIQGLKTLNKTKRLLEWFRQDVLSRTGEHGKTTIAGTRVGEEDFYGTLMATEELEDMLTVVKFPAIVTNQLTGEAEPLWKERYTMDNLDRMRKKAGTTAWERNYMMNPQLSEAERTFQDEHVDPCLDPEISLRHLPGDGNAIYLTLDPALGGKNCVMALEPTANNKLCVRGIWERTGLRANEQIMAEIELAIGKVQPGVVTDLVIETMNFQKGLARDERLADLRRKHGFALREHLTGWNKYDPNIGVPSMVTSFAKGEIILPWADDDLTRNQIGELVRQLKTWRPLERGNKLRQDMVMALWFGWILWRQRMKVPAQTNGMADSWRRQGVPWKPTRGGLIIPVGARI